MKRWHERYPRLTARFRDADGRGPQHSFFFPGEEYKPAYFDLIEGNEPAQRMLRDISRAVRFEQRDFGVLDVTMPLPEPPHDTDPPSLRGRPLHRFLAQVAKEVVSVPLGRRLIAHLRGDDDEEVSE